MQAQHQHHMPAEDTARSQVKSMMKTRLDSNMIMPTQHEEMNHHQNTGNMSYPFSLHLPVNRNGSGTGWLPDASQCMEQCIL